MKLEVQTTEFEQAYALVREWQARARAVRRQFLFRAVSKAYDDLLGLIPSDRKELRGSLRMDRIRGLPDSLDGYLIHSVPKGRGISKAEEESTVIYVSVKDNLMKAPPESMIILEDYSPWTMETLPYAPDPKTTDVISRRVSPREVGRVRRMRKRDKPEWKRRAIKAGVKVAGAGLAPRPRGMEAIPDTAFESLRLEFGLGGEPAKPHWRRAILKLALRGGAGMIARKREFTRAMTNLSFNAWERWPRRTTKFATVATAKKYVPFQKKLGLRVGRQ